MSKTILYVINVDWFFQSHFAHLANKVQKDDYEVILATEVGAATLALRAQGLRVEALPVQRRGTSPQGLMAAVEPVRNILAERPAALLHGFGAFGIVVGTLATRGRKNAKRVFTITGQGYSAVSREPKVRLMRFALRQFYRFGADGPSTRWLAENETDLISLGLLPALKVGRAAIVGGAGVNLDVFAASAMPPLPPLRLAFVARLIHSKGLDVAVKAVDLARERGCNVELTVAGSIDPGNPRSWSGEELAELGRRPGVTVVGHVTDVAGLWRGHHVAILPSRGGEGVPKTLLEAAACGRPILTTVVPGCVELAKVSHGWAVPVDDPEAFAQVIGSICQRREELQARGVAARRAIVSAYSEESGWQTIRLFYRELDTDQDRSAS